MALLKAWCDAQVQMFLDVCTQVNFPISEEKTFWASEQLVFLGFLVDPLRQMVAIPIEKIHKGMNLIHSVLEAKSKKITLKQLEQICGFLNFLGRATVPGRAFTRRLYMHINKNLKPHHHIRISSDMREDLKMWWSFLQDPSAYQRHFIDFSKFWEATEIRMFSDASKNPSLGCGAICDDSWAFTQWDPNFIQEQDPSIEYLELYAVLVAVLNWLHHFENRRIVLFCDNQSVVWMINKTTSSCKQCLVLIRMLILHSLKHNVRVFARYIKSKSNLAADLLSRFKIQWFRSLSNMWEDNPTPIAEKLWPMHKIWRDC